MYRNRKILECYNRLADDEILNSFTRSNFNSHKNKKIQKYMYWLHLLT